MSFPTELRTPRLLLRAWRAEDAAALQPVLEANQAHLGPWIPARVAQPAAIPILERRLAGFGADFAADREWRFGLFPLDRNDVFGEVALFPRDETGRVPFAAANRVEIGYWLRADETGRGLVNEAARAVLAIAEGISQFSHVELRCDARNAASVGVARRLGFTLSTPAEAIDQTWTRPLPSTET